MQTADSRAALQAHRRFHKILIPEIVFKDTSLADMCSFLADSTRARCGYKESLEEMQRMAGPRVILDPRDNRRIASMSMNRCTLAEAYWVAAHSTGCGIRIQADGTVLISSRLKSLKPLALKDPNSKFKDYTFPEIAFRDASAKDALRFINETLNDAGKPMRIKLGDIKKDAPTVSMNHRRITLSKALEIMQNFNGLEFAVE